MNHSLQNAKTAKQDEFYTQLVDIENELQHYTKHFKGKTVLCNCNDSKSNFFHYFLTNFERLQLKKLLTYDGDFRSEECIELLKQADIVVTNPPFSLFREYVRQLVQYEKKFLIIGNVNAISYKECFELIQKGKMWLGPTIHSGNNEFGVPDYYPLNATSARIDDAGNKFIRVKGVRWFTNLEHTKRHEDLILYRPYEPKLYPTYDNYDAIEVARVTDIPVDYDGVMGVPITFLDKYNPDQFEIVGSGRTLARPMSEVAEKGTYQQGGPCFYLANGNRTYRRMYFRLVIKRRLP